MKIFVLAALALCLQCAGAQVDQWSSYPLGGFGVSLPSTPKQIQVPNQPAGNKYWATRQGPINYVFGLNKIKDADLRAPADRVLSECIAGVVLSSKGTITGERDLLLEGWPGVEIFYKLDGGVVGRFRAFVVRGEVVNLSVSRPEGVEPEGVVRFLNSVKLPSDVPKGPLKTAGPELETFDLESTGFSARVPKGARSGPVKLGEGDAAVNLHRFAVAYLNRVYMGIVVDPPPNASRDIDDDVTGKAARAVNETIAGLFGGKIVRRDSRKTALGTCWTGEFDLGSGLTGRLETYVGNNHTYTLLAVAPQSLFAADEVKGFFDSIHLPK